MRKLIALISLSVLILFVSGCQDTPQPPKKPVIDQTLPKLADIKFLTELTDVGFEWKPSLDERVSGYYIYRSNPKKQNGKLERIATVKDKYASHYVDTKLKPNTQYYYRFSTYSHDKRESIPSDTLLVTTQPLIESIAFLKAITGLPHRIKLIWRPHTSAKVAAYIIQRSEFSTTKWKNIAKVKGRLSAEYIDAGLEDNRVYRYRVKVQTYDGLVSKPSQIVEAGTKPLPVPIQNLTASIDVPKKIVLNWGASSEKDFSYYKVYRAINPLLFYSYLAKTRDTSYEDLINDNGKAYYYFVTAVDKDGLESHRQQSSVAGSSLDIPESVYITSSNHDGRSINITWKSTDLRAMKFNVIKEYKDKKKIFTGIHGDSFNDSDVTKGIEYTYKVIAIDKYGLASKDSEKVIIEIPKEN
ncbi:fibronectin type III domain-containing protein [Sulfurospirillum arcachonense]|uniref:fibronectin type III domain-containing protein n=1 Tax=Sulfurospirillum arcachonense TaxID=57666 RepID=UPI00046A5192|nr:fibronectin type III domain-containing protein [Sulfurospirillum arcachonense]